jgi:hypothetical protein
MTYFARFPLLAYASNNLSTTNIVSDVLKRVVVDQKTKENLVIFDEYDVQDGDTPELVSFKFYETTQYHWVVLLVNDILDPRYDWPLTDEQLYTYTENKYGSANVNATHHYVVSENSDVTVDPTQINVVKRFQNFPENVNILFNYASNGTSTADLTEAEQAFVHFLQQPSSKPLPSTGILTRADITHDFAVTSTDALAAQRINLSRESAPDPDGPGPLTAIESYNQHLVYYAIKPIVESGNVELLPYLTSTTTPVSNTTWSLSTFYSDGTYYAINSAWAVTISEINGGTSNPTHPPLFSFLKEPVQYYYLNGDLTGSTRLSGIHYGSANTDAAVALTSANGTMTTGHVHYSNVINLLTQLSSNATIQPILTTTPRESSILANITLHPYANAYPVTNIAYESQQNESKRRIRILRAQYLSAFVNEFERLVNV